MRPFEITVFLKTPLLYHTRRPLYPLCLDALLTWAAAVEKRGQAALGPSAENLEEIPLPLRESGRKKKYYHASAVLLPVAMEKPGAVDLDNFVWVRSLSWMSYGGQYVKNWQRSLNGVNPRSGAMRQFQEELLSVTAPYVKFYGYGDIDETARLMGFLTNLGARRAAGGGEIHSFRIVPVERDYSVIGHDGYPARPIPVSEIDGRDDWFRTDATYRPPYWDVSRADICYMPPPERWCPTAVLPFRVLGRAKEYRYRKVAGN
jgi:CRISPR type IV-associated protein Csf3